MNISVWNLDLDLIFTKRVWVWLFILVVWKNKILSPVTIMCKLWIQWVYPKNCAPHAYKYRTMALWAQVNALSLLYVQFSVLAPFSLNNHRSSQHYSGTDFHSRYWCVAYSFHISWVSFWVWANVVNKVYVLHCTGPLNGCTQGPGDSVIHWLCYISVHNNF